MRSLNYLPVAALLIGMSCGQAPQPAAVVDAGTIARTVSEVVITDGTPVTMADLKIDGMSCEMMCGSAIKKALAGLPGITTTEIQFHEGEDADHAIVTYDESQVSDAQMIEAVQKIHDGAYKVMAISITKQVKSEGGVQPSSEPTRTEAQEGEVNASVQDAIVPGLLELLSRVVRR